MLVMLNQIVYDVFMPEFEVVAIGDTTVDIFLNFLPENNEIRLNYNTRELCVKYGEKIDVDNCATSIGGNASNVSVGLSRLGINTALAAELGDDSLSELILASLRKEKIDESLLIKTPTKSSSLSIVLSYQNDRTLFTDRPGREHLFDLRKMKRAKLIFLTSLGKEWKYVYQKVTELIDKTQIPLAFNPGSLQLHDDIELTREVIHRTHLLFVNKEEAEQLLFGKEPDKVNNSKEYVQSLMDKLAQQGVKICVITNGEYGSYTRDDEGSYYYNSTPEIKVVEKTGAGDAYTSGFLAAWQMNRSINEAMEWGTENAISVIGQVGAQAGLLNQGQIVTKLAEKRALEGGYSMTKLKLGYDNNLFILPFDHRNTFAQHLFNVKMEDMSDEQRDVVKDFKQVIYEGFQASINKGLPKEKAGILVDEEFGDGVLRDASQKGFVTILTTEKSGQEEFAFEYGEHFSDHIEKYKPTFVKVLIKYNPTDVFDSRQRQQVVLKKMSDYCHEHGHKFLVEVLVIASEDQLAKVNGNKGKYDRSIRPGLTVEMIKELQEAGVEPDVWKLEGLESVGDYMNCVHQVQIGERQNVGIVVLGRGADGSTVDNWIRLGAQVPGVIGFAVGRTIFWDAIVDYYNKKANREETIKKISSNFFHYYDVFLGK